VNHKVSKSPEVGSPPTPVIVAGKHGGSGGCAEALHITESFSSFLTTQPPRQTEGILFAAPISRLVVQDPSEKDSNVPAILEAFVEEIRARGLEEEGILRVPGSHSDIEVIIQLFESAGHARDVNLKAYDILSVGGAMKAWLRKIPHCFLTCDSSAQQQLVEWTQAHPTLDETTALTFKSMLESVMPISHLSVLRVLSQLVVDITAHEEKNKMTTDNVLTCLLPSLKIPSVIFIRLVQNTSLVFPSK